MIVRAVRASGDCPGGAGQRPHGTAEMRLLRTYAA